MTSAPPATPRAAQSSRRTAHHLDDDDAAVRFGGRVQPIDRFGREADARVETEAARRAVDVVVDRLRDADERDALLVELVRDGERAVAADADRGHRAPSPGTSSNTRSA
jgi:hypothetical protein